MPILNISTDSPGLSGVDPRLLYIATNDPIATVKTTGYISKEIMTQNFQFFQTDLALISTQENSTAPFELEFLQLSLVNGLWSLIPIKNDTITSVTANHIATYANNNGGLSQDPSTAINKGSIQALGGTIQAGQDGLAGNFQAYPAGVNAGKLTLSSVNNTGNFNVTITNNSHGQPTTYGITDPQVLNASILDTAIVNADVNANIITFDATLTAGALAGGAHVVLAGGLIGQYILRDLFINKGISLVGGDKNLAISDSTLTNIYTVIPNATLTSMVNERWGGSANLPYPTNVGVTTPLPLFTNLIASYTGGSTDSVSGSIVITGILERTG